MRLVTGSGFLVWCREDFHRASSTLGFCANDFRRVVGPCSSFCSRACEKLSSRFFSSAEMWFLEKVVSSSC